jgi:hypothetical protein
MPITDFLGDLKVDPEAKRIMGVAFEMVRVAVGFAGRGDLPNEVIAKKIIELAKAEGRNPDLSCEAVLEEFREQRFDPRLS